MQRGRGLLPLVLVTLAFPLYASPAVSTSGPPVHDHRAPAYVQGRPALAYIDSVWALGDKRAAHAALDTFIAATRASADRAGLGLALVLSAAQLVFFGDLAAAQPRLDEGMALARAAGDSAALLIGVQRQALIAERLGRTREADSLAWALLELARACHDARREGLALIGIGWSEQRAGELRVACDRYREAARLLELEEDWEGYLWALNNLCTAQQSEGAYQDAIATAKRVVALGREHRMPLVEAMALSNLGNFEYALGDPGVALEHYERAYQLHTELGALWEAIVPATNVAQCQIALGQHQAADSLLQHCLRTAESHNYLDRQGRVLLHLAELALERRRFHEAVRYCRRVLALGDTVGARTLIRSRIGLARALSQVDSLAEAIAVLEQEGAVLRRSPERDHRILLEIDLAKLLLAQGSAERALEHLRPALEGARAQGRQREQLLALTLAAKAQRALGAPSRARELLLEGVRAWEANRQLPLDPEWREQRAELGQQLFTDLARIMIEHAAALGLRDPVREAFDLLQPYKARTLLERMAGPGMASALVQAADTLGFADLVTLQRTVLAADEVFLDVYLGTETSVLFAVTRDAGRAVLLPPADALAAQVIRYRDLLATPPLGAGVEPEALARVAQGMSDRILGGVRDLMQDRRRAVIAPDGALNLVPFTEWMETAVWERVPSATVLMRLRETRRADSGDQRVRLVAFGGDGGPALPGGVREVRELGRRYRDVDARLLSAARDTLDASALEGPDVIHIASHIRLDDESPWQSRIRLGAETDPPRLTAGRIAQLRLPARLAVLAGCESAAGRVVSGEGVLGTASAFLSAGVPAVVAALWPVGDEATAALMLEFYAALADGSTAAAALRQAQSALRRDRATRHPFHWAGFVLIGDGGVRVPLRRRAPLALWLVPAAVLSLGVVACAARRGWRRRASGATLGS